MNTSSSLIIKELGKHARDRKKTKNSTNKTYFYVKKTLFNKKVKHTGDLSLD